MTEADLALRVLVGALCGVVIGFERARDQKSVGVRTLGLVGLSASLLIASVAFASGNDAQAISPCMQGLVTGVGFLGAGVILRGTGEKRVHGLTTAASIWASAILGAVAGLGLMWFALAAALTIFVLLAIGDHVDRWIGKALGPSGKRAKAPPAENPPTKP